MTTLSDGESFVTTDDWREAARRFLPRAVFDQIDGAAELERTARANVAAYDEVEFRPRALVNASTRNQSTQVLGSPVATPVGIAPTEFARPCHTEGEVAVARAAAATGAICCASIASTRSLQEIRAAGGDELVLWSQMYIPGRSDVLRLIELARSAGCAGSSSRSTFRSPRCVIETFVTRGSSSNCSRAASSRRWTTSASTSPSGPSGWPC